MQSLPFVWQIGLLLGFGLVLTSAADMVLRAATSLAKRYGLTSYATGFLLLGVITSTPEFFVAVQSAADGIPQLAVGNLIGGSILLLSLVMGISSVLLGRITLDHGLTFGEIVLSSFVVAAPVIVLWDGRLSRTDGLFLVGLYALHVFLLNRDKKILEHLHDNNNKRHTGYHTATIIVGFAAMAVSAKIIVETAGSIASFFSIPPLVFGLILLSLGTNLPEFALAVEAAIQRKKTVAFADFLGSSAANTLILGLLGLVSPFSFAAHQKLTVSLVLLGSVVAYFVWALSSRRDITRKEGLGLLFFYAIFIIYELSWQ